MESFRQILLGSQLGENVLLQKSCRLSKLKVNKKDLRSFNKRLIKPTKSYEGPDKIFKNHHGSQGNPTESQHREWSY